MHTYLNVGHLSVQGRKPVTKDTITTLFRYNSWANAKILNCADNLDEDRFSASTGHSHGSLKGLLFHMMRTEWVWRNLCQTGALTQRPLRRKNFSDLEAIQKGWAEEEKLMAAYLDDLSEADLNEVKHLKDRRGNVHTYEIWQMLVHLLLHSMQHRSEAAAILTDYGHSPGDLDFIFFIGEQTEA